MKYSKRLNFIIPVIYFLMCIFLSFNRIPFWDEARAWLIAQNCNFFELIDMMKLEGHTLIWYVLISPFAKLNLFYPYSMYLINTFFAGFAIFILFKFSPFKIYEKILIAFSVPFLFLWGVVARCYSIGILFLFLSLAFYKDRFKKPNLYILLLMISANTSVMAFFGAFFLSLIFIFEIKKEKYFKNVFLIFLISILIFILQLYSPHPDYMDAKPEMLFTRDFLAFIFNPIVYVPQYKIQSFLISLLRLSTDICTIFFIGFTFKNNKKVLFYIISTYTAMLILFCFVYSGNFWHYFYFYLYMITAFWVLKIENINISKKLNICFIVVLTCFVFKGALFIDSKPTLINNSSSKYIADAILNEQFFKDKKIFCLDYWGNVAPAALPYLKNKTDVFDIKNRSRFDYKSLRNQPEINKAILNPDEFCNYIDKPSILAVTQPFFNSEKKNPKRIIHPDGKISYTGEKCLVEFIPYKSYKEIDLMTYLIKVNKNIK